MGKGSGMLQRESRNLLVYLHFYSLHLNPDVILNRIFLGISFLAHKIHHSMILDSWLVHSMDEHSGMLTVQCLSEQELQVYSGHQIGSRGFSHSLQHFEETQWLQRLSQMWLMLLCGIMCFYVGICLYFLRICSFKLTPEFTW